MPVVSSTSQLNVSLNFAIKSGQSFYCRYTFIDGEPIMSFSEDSLSWVEFPAELLIGVVDHLRSIKVIDAPAPSPVQKDPEKDNDMQPAISFRSQEVPKTDSPKSVKKPKEPLALPIPSISGRTANINASEDDGENADDGDHDIQSFAGMESIIDRYASQGPIEKVKSENSNFSRPVTKSKKENLTDEQILENQRMANAARTVGGKAIRKKE